MEGTQALVPWTSFFFFNGSLLFFELGWGSAFLHSKEEALIPVEWPL